MTISTFQNYDQEFRQFLQTSSPEAVHAKINAMAERLGAESFGRQVARQMVKQTRPQEAVPEIYGHFRDLVRDGIEFFLSRISRRRLVDLVVGQLKMDPRADARERLLEMAKRFPTLHKLGQIIARNPHIDPDVKQWLIHLENGRYASSDTDIVKRIRYQLKHTEGLDNVQVRCTILAEASVGAVIPFVETPGADPDTIDGVFKILKPGIRRQLDEELAVLEETAAFFEDNRELYPLQDFKFLEVFQDVGDMLVKEVDLTAEQIHLAEAAAFYSCMPAVQIPGLLPMCTDTMTAMDYLDGPKIIDADLTPEQRRQCAGVLFEALVCRPLFAPSEKALFHGDPHAGNILAVPAPGSGMPRIGLVDWSLAGRLTRYQRIKTVQLIQAVHKKDLSGIRVAVMALAKGHGHGQTGLLRTQILALLHSAEFVRMPLMRKAFRLLEKLSYKGFVFPADLMLFRKAVFTLEGVLYDLCPGFDMDAAVMQYLAGLMTREIPKRLCGLLFPLADRPGNYPSLISNTELHSLAIHHCATTLQVMTQAFLDSFTGWSCLFGIGLP